MAASLVTLALTTLAYSANVITASQFALAAFSAFASGVVSASLAKRGRDIEPTVPVTARQPTAPHKIIYGTKRIGGTVVFMGTSDREENVSGDIRIKKDYHLHLVIALAGHEINAVKQLYFEDELIYDNGTYQTWRGSRTWDEFVTINVYDGTQTTADTTLINGDTYVLEGRTFTQTPVGTVVDAGDFVVGETYEIKTIGNTDFTAIGASSNTVGVEFTATGAGSGTGTAYESKTRWTSDHKLQGIAYVHIRLKHTTAVFPSGAPQISFVVEGKKVYDPDTGVTAFSNNPALCIRDYLIDTKHGLGESSANIDDTSFINIKDICDEDVALDGGGTQKRYTMDGTLDSSVSIKENLAKMLTSFNGELSYSGGKFYLTGGEYITPTVTISEADIVGPLQIVTKSSRRDTYNGVKGVFSSEENNYIDTDYPTATSTIYEAKDGEQILLDVSLPFTTNNIRAQRIAKQIMLQSRQQVVITLPLNLVGMKFKAGDTFYFTNTRLGYSNKPFKVQGWEMAFGEDGEIIVNVTAREAGAVLHPETADTYLTDVYQWQTSDEQEFVVTGKVPVPDASTVLPPTSLAATQSTIISSDGTVSSDFEITWTESENSFVDRYELQYRRTNSITGADGSTIAAETEPTSIFVFGTRYVLTGIADGDQYEVKIRALTPLGVQSNFATINLTATGDVTAPSIPTVNDIIKSDNKITLEFIAPSDKDTAHVDIFRVDDSRNIAASAGFGAMGSSPSGSGETVTDPSLRESPVTPDANTEPSVSVDATPGRIGYAVFNNVDNERIHFFFLRSRDYSGNTSDWSTVVRSIPEEEFQRGATKGAPDVVNDPEYGGNGKIKVGLVVADSIEAGAVTADKISVDDLSAIDANIGAITAGTLQGGETPPEDANSAPSAGEAGAFLDLTGGKFVFGDDSNYLLYDGSAVTLRGTLNADDLTVGTVSFERITGLDINNAGENESISFGSFALGQAVSDDDAVKNIGIGYKAGFLKSQTHSSTEFHPSNNVAIGTGTLAGSKTVLVEGERICSEGNVAVGIGAMGLAYQTDAASPNFADNVAIGRNALERVTISTGATPTGLYNVAIGREANSLLTTGRSNTAIGLTAQTLPGSSGDFDGNFNVAIGDQSLIYGDRNVAIGANARAGDSNGKSDTTAVGANSVATGIRSTAFGSYSLADGDFSLAIGAPEPTVTPFGEIVATDDKTRSFGERSLAMGYNARAMNDDAIAIGSKTLTSGINSVAVGNNAESAIRSVSIGDSSFATGDNSTAIGMFTRASGDYGVAFGQASHAEADNSIAIGRQVIVDTAGEIGIGNSVYNSSVVFFQTFKIRPSTSGTARYIFSVINGGTETDVFSIDTSGNMILAGTLTENGTP